MPFCIKCGQEIPVGASFCPNCGTPAAPKVTSSPVESALFTMEGFRGVPASRNLLVFTARRLIVALVSGEVKPFLTAGVIGELKERSKMKKLKNKTIEELLSDKKNYAIPYDEINSIEVTEGGTLKSGSITVNRTAGKPEKIFAYPRDVKKRIDDFNKLLKPILGERLMVEEMGIFGKKGKAKPVSDRNIPELIKALGDKGEQAQARVELTHRGPLVVSPLIEAFGDKDEEVGKQALEALKMIMNRIIDPSNIYQPTGQHLAFLTSDIPDMVEALIAALGDIHKMWLAYLALKHLYDETETRLPRAHKILAEVWDEVSMYIISVPREDFQALQAKMKEIIPKFEQRWRDASMWMW